MTIYDDNKDLYDEEARDILGESVEKDPAPRDPDNEAWCILPVKRGIDENFMKVWEICQKYGAAIIGGYVRWMVSPDEGTALPADIDVFLLDPDPTVSSLLPQTRFGLICDAFTILYPAQKEGPLSTYFFDQDDPEDVPSVNVVIPRRSDLMSTIGTIYEILDNFDFTVVRCALKDLETAIVDPEFSADEKTKSLHWKHINCPLAALYRMMKYSKKGYFARPKEAVKLLIDWEQRTEDYRTGLIEALQREDPTEEEITQLEELLWVD